MSEFSTPVKNVPNGPVIALLTDFQPKPSALPHFGSIHRFCEELQQRVSEVGGFFYVLNHQDLTHHEANGYYFENEKWIYSKLPLPDVIYNRIHSRKLEYAPSFKRFRETLEKERILFFNDRFLSKWEVYQHLMLEKQVHPFLPETQILSQESLFELINKYETVFIKPIHGSQGKNIIKLKKDHDSFSCKSSQDRFFDLPIKKFENSGLFFQLKPLLQNKIYIVQQGIPLAEYQDRTMDFRVLVHKNQEYKWDITSLVARISAEQQFVSNLAKGGEMMKPNIALQGYFTKKEMINDIITAIKELAIMAANCISKQIEGITGELGIDIGIDHIGKPWIIEINSKPSKSFGDTLTKIRPSAKAIIEFCRKLAFDKVTEMEE
jgi:glutathione synthase/RimK-type ligase-like ATP-grasp enzyme